MRKTPQARRERDAAREIVSDRTVIVGGITAGVVVAIASLFWSAPERAVQKLTGIGVSPDAEPTREELVGQAMRTGQHSVALAMLREAVAERPGSMLRVGVLAGVMAITGDVRGADGVLTECLGAEDSATAQDFARGITPFGDQRLDFMEGRWRVTQTGATSSVEADIRAVAGGRAFVEVWRTRRRGLSAVYVFDPARSRWTRSAVTGTGAVFAFSGLVESGRLVVDLRRRSGRPVGEEAHRMIVERMDGGGFERRFETRDADGLWTTTDAYIYRPWVPRLDGSGAVLY